MKNKFLSLLFLISTLSFSQVPGYMGKHFILGYSTALGPDQHPFSHAGSLDVVVSKNKELCFGIGYFKSISPGDYLNAAAVPLSVTSFSLGLKLFGRKSGGAPLGGYFKWEALYYINKSSYDTYLVYAGDNIYYPFNTYYSSTPAGTLKSVNIGGSFGIGKQRIFFDRLVIDYGLRVCIAFPADQGNTTDEYLKDVSAGAGEKVFEHESLTVHIGIGFLAF